MPVIIAAHPKATYQSNPFRNRRIYKYQTLQLVKHCVFAMTFASTSISYAVLTYRPILFMSMNDVKRCIPFYPRISTAMARFLGSNLYEIDKTPIAHIEIPEILKDRYDAYKYHYLVSKSVENKRTKDIVFEFLRTA
jgi:hypothetical protein